MLDNTLASFYERTCENFEECIESSESNVQVPRFPLKIDLTNCTSQKPSLQIRIFFFLWFVNNFHRITVSLRKGGGYSKNIQGLDNIHARSWKSSTGVGDESRFRRRPDRWSSQIQSNTIQTTPRKVNQLRNSDTRTQKPCSDHRVSSNLPLKARVGGLKYHIKQKGENSLCIVKIDSFGHLHLARIKCKIYSVIVIDDWPPGSVWRSVSTFISTISSKNIVSLKNQSNNPTPTLGLRFSAKRIWEGQRIVSHPKSVHHHSYVIALAMSSKMLWIEEIPQEPGSLEENWR